MRHIFTYFMYTWRIFTNLGLGHTYVISEGERRVISAPNRVGSSYYSTSCSQRSYDASLGYGDALLLHGLVDTRSVSVIHLQVNHDS